VLFFGFGLVWGLLGLLLIVIVDHSLVGGLEHEFYDFLYIGNFIIPPDELIFFRWVETTNQVYSFPFTKMLVMDFGPRVFDHKKNWRTFCPLSGPFVE
jgi:uncharacterized membrane protein SpoIIM required for sporulation